MLDDEVHGRNNWLLTTPNKLLGSRGGSLAELIPPHPKARAAAQKLLQQSFANLIADWGSREARRMWQDALKATPAKRGRPLGARTKMDGFDPWRALQCLYTFANDPKAVDWSRWQVIRAAATFLSDFGGAGATPDDMLRAYEREQDPKVFNAIKLKQNKYRKAAIEAMHMRLAREQDQVDAKRKFEHAVVELYYSSDPRYSASLMSPDERADKLMEARMRIDLAFPPLRQNAGTNAPGSNKKPTD